MPATPPTTETATATIPAAGATPTESGQGSWEFKPTAAGDVDALSVTISGSPPSATYVSGLAGLKWALTAAQTMAIRVLGAGAPVIRTGSKAVYRFRVVVSDLTKAFSVGLMSGSPVPSLVVNGVFLWWDGSAAKLALASGAASTANYSTSGSELINPGGTDVVLTVLGGAENTHILLHVNGRFVGSLWNVTLPASLAPHLVAVGAADVTLIQASVQVAG